MVSRLENSGGLSPECFGDPVGFKLVAGIKRLGFDVTKSLNLCLLFPEGRGNDFETRSDRRRIEPSTGKWKRRGLQTPWVEGVVR